MTSRPLELFDLPKLSQFRSEIISLDCAQILTRGNPLRAANFLMHLNPTRRIYTAIHESNSGEALLGSIRQLEGENFTRLTYLAPNNAFTTDMLLLIEHLVEQAKHWQAYHVVVEIEESSPLFQPLRQSGFSVYARQRVWDLSEIPLRKDLVAYWRRSKDVDRIAIQNLQRQIVPPLLQQVESFGNLRSGAVCRNDELLAYVDTIYGGRGIFLRPLIHPNTDKVREKLISLLSHNLANRRQRPVYFCVRSYQAWVEPILEDMEANVGPRQVVMVKHLASIQRAEKTVPRGTDTAWANPAAPIQSSKIKGKKTL
jgi:hypothetical protein